MTSGTPPSATSTGSTTVDSHGEITTDNTYLTPAEFEASNYRQATPADEAVTQ
jgi:hypothetical protein